MRHISSVTTSNLPQNNGWEPYPLPTLKYNLLTIKTLELMLNVYLNVLKDLIKKGEIKKDDKIVEETMMCLIDMLCRCFPPESSMNTYVKHYVEKVFYEELEI